MAFQIARLELDRAGHTVERRPLQPIFELHDDAMALAQFDASRCNGEFGYDADRDCWWAEDSGCTYRFIVEAVRLASEMAA